ncbi:MAG: riboflavin synthase [Chromatiales bacterium]
MFAGIVEAIGQVTSATPAGENARLVIDAGNLSLADVKLGDSIAVNGVCLTVVGLESDTFSVDVSPETLRCTTLASVDRSSRVNLEKALIYGERVGGHLVSGHVDGIGRIMAREQQSEALGFAIVVPDELMRYIAVKGSVCIDGVSLTVNEIEQNAFAVQVIPHTRDSTLFGTYQLGDRVNVEVDLIARYLESLLRTSGSTQ